MTKRGPEKPVANLETWDVHGQTDTGKRRKRNEDQFLIAEIRRGLDIQESSLTMPRGDAIRGTPLGQLLCVADGLGGHSHGKRASQLAVRTTAEYLTEQASLPAKSGNEADQAIRRALATAVRESERAIDERTSSNGRGAMGTTLTIAYVRYPSLYIAHAGDSRAYLLRGDRLRKLTVDHTLADRLVTRGVVPRSQRDEVPGGQALWNVVGAGGERVSPDVTRQRLREGDVLLLCTDGLTQSLSEDRIREIVGLGGSSRETCRRLIREANRAGGLDNITVVMARVGDAARLAKTRDGGKPKGGTTRAAKAPERKSSTATAAARRRKKKAGGAASPTRSPVKAPAPANPASGGKGVPGGARRPRERVVPVAIS